MVSLQLVIIELNANLRYERQKTYVMVLERPANSIDLFEFCKTHGPLSEALARFVFQQVFTTVYRLK